MAEECCYFLPVKSHSDIEDPPPPPPPSLASSVKEQSDEFIPLFPNEDDYLVNLRQLKYSTALKNLHDTFSWITSDWKFKTFERIRDYLFKDNNHEKEIRTFNVKRIKVAYLYCGGMDLAENKLSAKEFCRLCDPQAIQDPQIKENRWIVHLPCKGQKSLKQLIATITEDMLIQMDCSASLPSAYGLTFDTLVQKAGKSTLRITIVLDFIESLKREVLDEFIEYINVYQEESIQINLLIIGSMPDWNLHEYFNKNSLSKLSIEKFTFGSVEDVIDDLFTELFIALTPEEEEEEEEEPLNEDIPEDTIRSTRLGMQLGIKAWRFLLQQYHWIHGSLSLLKRQLVFCLGEYYFLSPLSVLSSIHVSKDMEKTVNPPLNEVLTHFSTLHYEAIRMLPSFQAYVENNLVKDPAYVKSLLLDTPVIESSFDPPKKKKKKSAVPISPSVDQVPPINKYITLALCQQAHYSTAFSNAFRIYSLLQQASIAAFNRSHSSGSNVHQTAITSTTKKRSTLFDLYYEIMEAPLHISASISESSKQSYLRSCEIFQSIQKKSSAMTLSDWMIFLKHADPYFVNNCHEIASFLEKGSALEAIALEAPVKIEKFVAQLNSYLKNYLELHLKSYLELELQEVTYFDDDLAIRKAFNPNPKASLQNALLNPHYFLQCRCCRTGQGRFSLSNGSEEQEKTKSVSFDVSSLQASLPDISIVYRIYVEFGRWINLQDWYRAFLSVIEKPNTEQLEKDHDTAALYRRVTSARFIQCISELYFFGFIKLTSKRKEFAMRLTFDSHVVDY